MGDWSEGNSLNISSAYEYNQLQEVSSNMGIDRAWFERKNKPGEINILTELLKQHMFTIV